MDDNRNVRRLRIGPDGLRLDDFASLLLDELRDDAHAPASPERLRRDWHIVEAWLGATGRELTSSDYEQFAAALRAYLIRGLAPSRALESVFESWSRHADAEAGRDVPPLSPELIPVFDRLFASDEEMFHQQLARQLESTSESAWTQDSAHTAQRDRVAVAVLLDWIPIAASIVMLLVAALGQWPSGSYQLLRVVVCATATFTAIQTSRRHPYWPWVMAGVAVLFNPILPMPFELQEWRLIEAGAAVLFVFALFALRARR